MKKPKLLQHAKTVSFFYRIVCFITKIKGNVLIKDFIEHGMRSFDMKIIVNQCSLQNFAMLSYSKQFDKGKCIPRLRNAVLFFYIENKNGLIENCTSIFLPIKGLLMPSLKIK